MNVQEPLVYVVTWADGDDWNVVAVAGNEAMAKTICARNALYRYEAMYIVWEGSDPWRPAKEDGT